MVGGQSAAAVIDGQQQAVNLRQSEVAVVVVLFQEVAMHRGRMGLMALEIQAHVSSSVDDFVCMGP